MCAAFSGRPLLPYLVQGPVENLAPEAAQKGAFKQIGPVPPNIAAWAHVGRNPALLLEGLVTSLKDRPPQAGSFEEVVLPSYLASCKE